MAMSHAFIALSSHHPGVTYWRGSVIERLERMRKAMGSGLCVTCCRVCLLHDVKTFPIFTTQSNFRNPNSLLRPMTIWFTRTFANAIYCITCTPRKKIHRRTDRNIDDHSHEHFRDVERDDKDEGIKTSDQPFKSSNYFCQNIAYCVLSLYQGNAEFVEAVL